MKRYLPFLLLLLLIPLAAARSDSIKLVSASLDEQGNVVGGSTPDMYLEIRPGSDNIYIDSLPLTKIDTQISTRFAKAVACDFLEIDCSNYDFFYKIRSDSNLIGGPSAGGAITVLTIAVLDGKSLNKDVVMTGTINSGGLIGPVAGIREKAIAAQEDGLKVFLVPKLSVLNQTVFDQIKENLTIQVIPVSTLQEALYYFTGKNYSKPPEPIMVPEFYNTTMFDVSEKLCERYADLNQTVQPLNKSEKEAADFFYNNSLNSLEQKRYYSRASFCFSANLRLRELQFENLSQEKLSEVMINLYDAISKFENKINAMPLQTISDLETYMAVQERLMDAEDFLKDTNTSNISSQQMAYALERYYSAVYWSEFFDIPGPSYDFADEMLRDSCLQKIEETRERLDYVDLYFPLAQSSKEKLEDLSRAYEYYQNQDYELCLFKASKVKAEADLVLTALFIEQDQLDELLDERFIQAKKVIVHQQELGMFPILGYSYYQYAESLKDSDPYSSLLYLEYVLELSNLDMYFPPKKSFTFPVIDVSYLFVLICGLFVGFLIAMIIFRREYNKINKKINDNKPRKTPRKVGISPGKRGEHQKKRD